MCKNSDPKEACGWPSGTVRASYGYIVIPSIIGLLGAGMIILFVREQYESALGLMNGLSGILGTVIGYYFGSRSTEVAHNTLTKIEHEKNEIKHRKLDFQIMQLNNDTNVERGIRKNLREDPDCRINMENEVEEINSGR